MGIKGLNWDEVDERVPIVARRTTTYTANDLIDTIDRLASRLYVHDFAALKWHIDEVRRFLRQHYGVAAATRAIDTTLLDFGALCFLAGIHEADGEPYESGSARVDAVLIQVRARLTAAPEGEDLRTPQANGENGVTQV